MLAVVLQLSGGIGLFLLGMTLLTDSLKALAGDSLRQWLARFTGSSFKAMLSGIGFTLVVQSSTATTLATIGFVSAGVLSFSQAIGIIIGANIGTTSTGWLVAFLGLKFSIANIALPLVALGAMLKLLGRDQLALSGLALAGFALLFMGIDQLQVAMAGFAEQVNLSQWSNDGFATRLILILIGLVMTILLQSSSAAVTATLAALASQAIDLPQAMALVIGQNIGTVATAVLAAVGATTSAKRTAAVHVVFNIVTAIFALFVLMPVMLWLFQHTVLADWDHVVMLAAFHTAFSLMGALLFMPFIPQFQQLIIKLIPEKNQNNTRYLDETLFAVPALAISATEQAIRDSLADYYRMIVKALQGQVLAVMMSNRELDRVLTTVEQYLQKMPVPQAQVDQQHLTTLLRLIMYSKVLRDDFQYLEYVDVLPKYLKPEVLQPLIIHLQSMVLGLKQQPMEKMNSVDLIAWQNLVQQLKQQQPQYRQHIVENSVHAQLNAAEALDAMIAERWLERLLEHSIKIAYLLQHQDEVMS
ncbi:Na/Pi cotransporter family protein [Acinetobacter qingfengensis]|uniref:Na/Pi cotransporter n=1 Tax=Acinetobacter qingfengensis TaxID=1262585 RepID=A0A1E7RFA8_9GAMM|nr:Na/Pi symporter [Acinetobacter qingfengensis]KAA8731822.1 Na/Pi cotransporter family protein [Acinetobacter qingfengensis]OEY98054.1 Na/Pi cotransporter [Acinetobacter qingfengensis]